MFNKKKKKAPDVVDAAVPDLSGILKNDTQNMKYLFYMFYQIRQNSGLESTLIHLNEDFAGWWEHLWTQYEHNIKALSLKKKLTSILDKNFTREDLEILSSMDEFFVKGGEQGTEDLGSMSPAVKQAPWQSTSLTTKTTP